MTKKILKNNLVSGEIVKEIQLCRPLRLFINKQKKKGNDANPFALRSKFLQLPTEKQVKYYQKAIDKFIELLDEKDIDEHIQLEGQLFENVLSKKEQKTYFESINAPSKPRTTPALYYSDIKKQDNAVNPKPWKSLSTDERKPYIQALNDIKAKYAVQVKTFASNLPERLKAEYLSFINQKHTTSHANSDNDEHGNLVPITQRRKSVQSLPESFKTSTSDNPQKLDRIQLDDLHKCKPNVLYFEKKIPDDEKPIFGNTFEKNNYIRSFFNKINEKKRHKFILKSTKKWEEYLELNPRIIENQIPTLHLLLGKQDDIYFYFSSLGLPIRPPVSAPLLYKIEKQQTNWADLPQTTKDEYIKSLSKLKNEYREKFIEFVEKTLPSDYLRLEFFRNVKHASKDYELFTKDRINNKDEGQLKITQYLTSKKKENKDINEFDRIKQQLLTTQLNNEQKKLVERLGQLMNKYIEETTASKKSSSNSKSATTTASQKRQSMDSDDVVIINGEISSDDGIEDSEEINKKKKKKRKRDKSEVVEASTTKTNNNKEKQHSSSSTTKKRK